MKLLTHTINIFLSSLLAILVGCGGSSEKNQSNPPAIPQTKSIDFEFSLIDHGWQVDFADLPINSASLYELDSNHESLPVPLENLTGLLVTGNNHSDDLFMYIKKQFSGFDVNQQYDIAFELTFATNAPKECQGVGGPPGEGVTVKIGSTIDEPMTINDGNDNLIINLDKGNQISGGSDAIVIGDFASQQECNAGDFVYETKKITSLSSEFTIMTDGSGKLWFVIGTDSGFEATTAIYYLSGKITATPV